MRIRQRMKRTHRQSRVEGANWLNFSDLMSSLLLMFILIMFYIMYQYFDMYEINMAEIARQQYDLDQANADLDEKTAKLTEAESQMVVQQIRLTAAQKDLDEAESILAQQKEDLNSAQTLLSEKEQQIAAQKDELDALGIKLNIQQDMLNLQQSKLDEQQVRLDEQQIKLDDQQTELNTQKTMLNEQQQTMDAQQTRLAQQQVTMDAQQMKLNAQQTKLEEQQQTLEDQQVQIEQLVGLKTRIITSLSNALRAANISAQVDPTNGSIALESDVLFAFNQFDLTAEGKQFIDEFLPVYLDVLLSPEYGENVTEIIIEGHTDSAGDYIRNLQLSQQRALAVASYVLADNYSAISASQKERLRTLVTANGRSESDPVLDEYGREDMDASRRVVFKFRMTDEQMIEQLKNILEKE